MDDCNIFTYTNKDFINDVCLPSGHDGHQTRSRFDIALRSGWTEKMNAGLFRYHLGDLETRVLPGSCGFIAQLNIMRGIERRKPQEILTIRQNFDPKQFNFNKINPKELLFELQKENETTSEQNCHQNGLKQTCKIIINVSPLEFGHCLLVPEPSRCYPQILTPLAVQIGIETVLLSADPGFRVGFNSMGGFASVNHLHLHGYYLNYQLRIESSPSELILPENNLYCLVDFPAGFLFYTQGPDLDLTVSAICKLADIMVDKNIAHNLFITRGCPPNRPVDPFNARKGVRVIVWPRLSCFGAKEESAFSVALCELAGHLPFKNKEDYETITEDGVKAIIQKYLLSEEEFSELQKHVIKNL
ncbi:GDP-D-glucose phosphorylase 1 [Myxocyprinus asiaticus]|uniref:GDP-D-glucose phosphorylase 1 n=1 Tax=Myxocyprinus asiaticus TaxID=70543 RepID=UPI002222BB90|nr:GDP-D-glucose phosphorylase 1 [Myxocyprinus asiaticus]